MQPPKPDDSREPVSYFQLQRRRDGLPEPGEEKVSSDISQLPPLPPSSPWSSANVIPDEPLVDRSEDGDVTGFPIDQHDGGNDS
jgi:hypothetical protein